MMIRLNKRCSLEQNLARNTNHIPWLGNSRSNYYQLTVSPLSSCTRRLRDHFDNSASALSDSLSLTAGGSLAHWPHSVTYSFYRGEFGGSGTLFINRTGGGLARTHDNSNQITVYWTWLIKHTRQVLIGSWLGTSLALKPIKIELFSSLGTTSNQHRRYTTQYWSVTGRVSSRLIWLSVWVAGWEAIENVGTLKWVSLQRSKQKL